MPNRIEWCLVLSTIEPRESDFIGRQRELAVLSAALEDALAGRGRLVMLAGKPGIGKARIAQELAALAESKGARVLGGWCYEHGGAPAYWPWVRWAQSATCWGMPIETSRIPPTPTVTRVSRVSRAVTESPASGC